MKYLLRFLNFCNILDRKQNLSITNIAVIVLLVKIAAVDSIDWPTVGALLAGLLNYINKRKETIKFEQ